MLKTLARSLSLCLLSLTFALSVLAQQPTTAQSTTAAATPEVQLMRAQLEEQRALREEIRQLRAIVQRISLATYRSQMLNDRLARQRTRVDTLTEEIEQLKAQVQQLLDTSRDEEELNALKAAIENTPDPQTRAQLVLAYQTTQRSQIRQRELSQQEAERNRVRQQNLESNLRQEQVKLSELNEQLDALEREFERPTAEPRNNSTR